MRNILATLLGAFLVLSWAGVTAHAQVINGEGTFESNGGFDRSPEEAEAAPKAPKPDAASPTPDERKAR